MCLTRVGSIASGPGLLGQSVRRAPSGIRSKPAGIAPQGAGLRSGRFRPARLLTKSHSTGKHGSPRIAACEIWGKHKSVRVPSGTRPQPAEFRVKTARLGCLRYSLKPSRSKLPLSGRNHPRWRPGAAGHPSRAASTLKPTGSDLRTLCGLLRLGSSLCASQPAKGTASGRRIFVEQTLCRCARGTCGLTVSFETASARTINLYPFRPCAHPPKRQSRLGVFYKTAAVRTIIAASFGRRRPPTAVSRPAPD